MKTIILSILCLLFSVSAGDVSAQFFGTQNGKETITDKTMKDRLLERFGLKDGSKWDFQQSYSMMYSSYSSSMYGMYGGTLLYRPSDDWNVKFHLRYLHQPFANRYGQSSHLQRGKFLPGIEITRKFGDNKSLYIKFDTVPYYSSYGYGRDSFRYGHDPFFGW